MEVSDRGGRRFQLTWCTNVHPCATTAELLAMLRGPARRIRDEVAEGGSLGLGLWFAAGPAAELVAEPGRLADLRELLAGEGFHLATVNAFPMGPFHGEKVKERVYRPDWSGEERLSYTVQVMEIAATLAAPGTFLPVSTLPLGLAGPAGPGREACLEHLVRAALAAQRISMEKGVELLLCLEPEPGCLFERGGDLIPFLAGAVEGHAEGREVREACRRRLGLCLDTCHCDVMGEEPAAVLAEARERGVPVGKLQLAGALELAPVRGETLAALAPFAEPVYCHQAALFDEEGRQLASWMDLDQVLAESPPPRGARLRVHFHTPLHWRGRAPLAGTAARTLPPLLARGELLPPVLEVETYTWSVLPGGGDPVAGIAAELAWARGHLTGSA